MSSIQAIRTVERQIRTAREQLEVEQDKLKSLDTSVESIYSQIDKDKSKHKKDLLILEEKMNNLCKEKKEINKSLENIKSKISSSYTYYDDEIINKNNRECSRLEKEKSLVERSLRKSDDLIVDFLLGSSLIFAISVVLSIILIFLFRFNVFNYTKYILLFIGFSGVVWSFIKYIVYYFGDFQRKKEEIYLLQQDIDKLRDSRENYTRYKHSITKNAKESLLLTKKNQESEIVRIDTKIQEIEHNIKHMNDYPSYKESYNIISELNIKIYDTKNSIDNIKEEIKRLTIQKSDLEQDWQDIKDTEEDKFMTDLMKKVRKKKALLDIDLEAMKKSLLAQAEVDYYKLRLVEDMQRQLRNDRFMDIKIIQQQMKSLGLGG